VPPCLAVQAQPEVSATIVDENESADVEWADEEDPWAEEEGVQVADPLESVNRLFFQFNDRLYYWVLKPVATGYSRVVGKDFRICIRNIFSNLLAPGRIVNNLLQGKVENSFIEAGRFVINSSLGILGAGDVARSDFNLTVRDEDFGQTIGFYGAGAGFYINWPVLGPSNARDTIGLVADTFLDPLAYVMGSDYVLQASVYSGKKVNQVSLSLGDYEVFTETAMDPYAAVRDAYNQYRQGRIEDKNIEQKNPL
jgi:phospholipid-binding lipoprotein MlaA